MPSRQLNPAGRIEDAMSLVTSKGVGQASAASRAGTAAATQAYLNAAYQTDYHQMTGLSFYKNALSDARVDIQQGYQQAISELRPQQEASRTALDEMMRFVGIDPAAATSGMTDALRGLGEQTDTSRLNNLIREAQAERDPTRRAELKAAVDAEFATTQDALKTYTTEETARRQASLQNPELMGVTRPEMSEYMTPYEIEHFKNSGGSAAIGEKRGAYQAAMADYQKKSGTAQEQYNRQVSSLQNQRTQIAQDLQKQQETSLGSLTELQGQFGSQYKSEYDAAYTGEQITEKLRATPGYQFQEQAGVQAIERASAAKGMLGSANTLLGVQRYGQDLAASFYDRHLQNLSNIAGQGSGAVTQIANLYQQKGGALAQINQLKGEGTRQAYGAIGSAYTDAYNRIGSMEYDADKSFAAQKLSAQEAAKSRATSIAQSLIQNEPAMRQADINQGANSALAGISEDLKDQEKESSSRQQGLMDQLLQEGQAQDGGGAAEQPNFTIVGQNAPAAAGGGGTPSGGSGGGGGGVSV